MTDLINRKRPNLFDPSVQLAPASSSSSKAIKDSNSYSNQTLQDIDESKNSNITRTKVNDMKIANESRGSTKHQNIGNQDIRVDFSQLHHAREILQTFETRHYSVMYEHLILTRENLGLQNRLSSVKQSYSVVNQSVQRACDSVECLQTLVKGIEKRLVNIKKFKGQVEERVFSLSNLLDSVQAAKSKMVRKIATLEHEALDLRKNTVSNERKFQVDLDTVNTANGLLREEIKNLEANRSELVKDMSEKSKIMEEMKAYINELKSTIDTSKSEYSKKLELVDLNMNSQIKVSRDLLTSLSIALKTQAPSSFGDSSMAALTNVMEEILCEHTVMVNSEKKEIQVTLDHLAGRLDTETELLKNSNKENGEILLKINLLQNDVEQKKADILTLESSIQAFQKESGQTAAKLADLQRIKIIANIVEDILGVNGKCIDYEEMRCLLLVRLTVYKKLE